jgi:hypothetical protein
MCNALTKKGTKCKLPSGSDGFCHLHKNIQEQHIPEPYVPINKHNQRVLDIVENILLGNSITHWVIFAQLHFQDLVKFDLHLAFKELVFQYGHLYPTRRGIHGKDFVLGIIDQTERFELIDMFVKPEFDQTWNLLKQIQYKQFQLEYLKLRIVFISKYGSLITSINQDQEKWRSIKIDLSVLKQKWLDENVAKQALNHIEKENLLSHDVSNFILKQYF